MADGLDTQRNYHLNLSTMYEILIFFSLFDLYCFFSFISLLSFKLATVTLQTVIRSAWLFVHALSVWLNTVFFNVKNVTYQMRNGLNDSSYFFDVLVVLVSAGLLSMFFMP